MVVEKMRKKCEKISSFKFFQIAPIASSSVADPDPGSGAFLTPGSGMGNKSRSG
jgi:hypothetical protein